MILGTIILIIVCLAIVYLVTSFTVALFGAAPFVPTPMPAVKKILEHAKIKKGQTLVDIGAGDGRFLHIAETLHGAKATGFEIDPCVYILAKIRQWVWGWKGKMVRGSFVNHDLSKTNILICYMMPRSLKKYQKKLDKELKKGTKILSYTFSIGDWQPKKVIPAENGIKKIWIYEI